MKETEQSNKHPARGAALARLRRRLTLLSRFSRQHHSDVDGSYTGTPADGEQPVQDADDL